MEIPNNEVNDALVNRYMPSYLPFTIIKDDYIVNIVNMSWKRALSGHPIAFQLVRTELIARGELYRSKPDVAFHTVFYGRLFELIPEVQAKFRAGGMIDQGNLFTRMFDFAVREISNSDNFSHQLTMLAKFHNGFGVIPYDYAVMGQTLFYTLRRFLGEEFTKEVELAWLHFYGAMMREIIPAVVSGDKLKREEKISFLRSLKEVFKDPDYETSQEKNSKDLRGIQKRLTQSTPTAGRLTTLGRGYLSHDRELDWGKLPKTDRPTTISLSCTCGSEMKVRVPITLMSANAEEKKSQSMQNLPNPPPASNKAHNVEAVKKGPKKRFALSIPAERPLHETINPLSSMVSPKASGAESSHETDSSTTLVIGCPHCQQKISCVVPVEYASK